MEIEVARLYRTENGGRIKGFADVVFAGQVLVKGVRIVEGRNGLFITMPQTQGRDGKFYPTTMLLDESLKEELQKVVMEAYQS